jgi:hypothetical protein
MRLGDGTGSHFPTVVGFDVNSIEPFASSIVVLGEAFQDIHSVMTV